jgi:hypothetical protein
VQYESGANVKHVLVEGEVVVRDGRCVKLSEEDVVAEAHAIATELARGNEAFLSEVDADAPHLLKLLLGALERPVAPNRFLELR